MEPSLCERDECFMVIGVDIGGSAIKIAGLRGDEIVFTCYEKNGANPAEEVLAEILKTYKIVLGPEDSIALTGVGAGRSRLSGFGVPVIRVPEIEAVGTGGTWLSGCGDAVIVSLGTGTAFILYKGGRFTHLGGSGIGGGTFCGLGRKILGTDDFEGIDKLSETGCLENIDLRVGDLFNGSGTLNPELTASNLFKAGSENTDGDWAAGIINTVLQAVGTMAMLACGGHFVGEVVIIGALSRLSAARGVFSRFEEMYGIKYTIARHPECATAIGAARRI